MSLFYQVEKMCLPASLSYMPLFETGQLQTVLTVAVMLELSLVQNFRYLASVEV